MDESPGQSLQSDPYIIDCSLSLNSGSGSGLGSGFVMSGSGFVGPLSGRHEEKQNIMETIIKRGNICFLILELLNG